MEHNDVRRFWKIYQHKDIVFEKMDICCGVAGTDRTATHALPIFYISFGVYDRCSQTLMVTWLLFRRGNAPSSDGTKRCSRDVFAVFSVGGG